MHIGKFQLCIEARQPIILPPYKGSTLRGGFGNAFKKIVCALKEKDCPGCILKERCVYSYVFETPPPDGAKVMRKYVAVPHPFIIEPPLERKMGYKPGDELTFGLTLIGKAIDYLPYFIYTFDELGNIGIGNGRGKYALKAVRQVPAVCRKDLPAEENGDLIYSSETKKLTSFHPEDLHINTVTRDEDDQASALTLNFLTPARIYHNGKLTCDLEFHILIRQLLRRISMLSHFHCGTDPAQWDFQGLINKAKEVKIKNKNLRWFNWQRYSSRQEQKINMGGFVGEVTYEGHLTPFLSLIRAGEILHVGKAATFGLGRYEMIINNVIP